MMHSNLHTAGVSVIDDHNDRMGEILQDAGILSDDDAKRILAFQQRDKLSFGEAGRRLGLLCERDVQFALARQYRYDCLPPAEEGSLSPDLVAAHAPFGEQGEQLRAIRSQLLLRWFNRDARGNTLAVVGASRHEGRSHIAANLAILFSQLGTQTLLIDADMRTPRLHKLFNLDNSAGLSSLLAGRSVGSAVHSISAFPSLEVLPAGPIPPNPLELIERSTFDELLARARIHYQLILIDTPALAESADAHMIAVRSSAALIVARNHHTRTGAFARTVADLRRSGILIVGSVLNEPPVA